MRNSGHRKGAWNQEEDLLLRKCIEKYGEGKWHQVPHRAGLNRCRKSCRLRWLNYLHPNINRGEFKEDEIDLIMKMHKLLGNRWSLIAGRLPGRTANDIKNYWNSHLSRKIVQVQPKVRRSPEFKNDKIMFQPQPRPSSDIVLSQHQETQQQHEQQQQQHQQKLKQYKAPLRPQPRRLGSNAVSRDLFMSQHQHGQQPEKQLLQQESKQKEEQGDVQVTGEEHLKWLNDLLFDESNDIFDNTETQGDDILRMNLLMDK